MATKSLDMEWRRCDREDCGKKFRAVIGQRRKYCSAFCIYKVEQCQKTERQKELLAKNEQKAGETMRDIGNDITQMKNLEKKSLPEVKSGTSKDQMNKKNEAGQTKEKYISKTQTVFVKEKESIEIITRQNHEMFGIVGMSKTKSENEKKSMPAVLDVTPPMDLTDYSTNLTKEISQSLILLNDSVKELHSLMKRLNPPLEISDNVSDGAVKLLDPDRVRTAAECGKQIISTMRLQLDMLKFAKECQGKNGESK